MSNFLPLKNLITKNSEKRRYNEYIAMLGDEQYDRYVERGISLLFNQSIPKPPKLPIELHRTIITYLTGREKDKVIEAFYLVPWSKDSFFNINIPSFNFTSEAKEISEAKEFINKLLNEPKYPIQNLEMPLLMDIPDQSPSFYEKKKTKTCCFL